MGVMARLCHIWKLIESDVGRFGIEPDSCRLKGGCITIVANVPLFLWPVSHGHEFAFRHVNLLAPEMTKAALGFPRRPSLRTMRVMEEPPLRTDLIAGERKAIAKFCRRGDHALPRADEVARPFLTRASK